MSLNESVMSSRERQAFDDAHRKEKERRDIRISRETRRRAQRNMTGGLDGGKDWR